MTVRRIGNSELEFQLQNQKIASVEIQGKKKNDDVRKVAEKDQNSQSMINELDFCDSFVNDGRLVK